MGTNKEIFESCVDRNKVNPVHLLYLLKLFSSSTKIKRCVFGLSSKGHTEREKEGERGEERDRERQRGRKRDGETRESILRGSNLSHYLCHFINTLKALTDGH